MKYLHAFVYVIFLLGVVGCPDDPPPPVETAHLGSRVELVAGEVWLKSGSDSHRIMTGAMLEEGAKLRADKGSRALVRLNNGAGIFLKGNTEVEIQNEAVLVKRGQLWADVPELETALAHFDLGGVKVTATGAGMDIFKNDKQVRVYVARGLAVVESAKGRVEVSAGEQAVVKKGAPKLSPVTFFEDWTGGMADRPLQAGQGGGASGRIYGIDRSRPGSPPSELQIVSQQIKSIIRDGVAYTTVDQTFFNSSSADVEGWYWFTVPEGASVVRFAWEVNGQMVDGRVVERKQAAAAYEAAVERAIDPALLEWIDARTCRARIFPVPAAGNRRIILAYTEMLPLSDGAFRYVYPMVGDEPVQIQEFSLQVDLGDDGEDFEISTLQDARVSDDGRVVSMRRSGYVPRSDFLLELRPKGASGATDNLRVMRFDTGANEADFVMLRYTPAVDWKAVKEVPGDVVVVLDSSAGGDMAEYQTRLQAAEAILRALGESDHFAVMSTDLTPRVLFPQKGLANATDTHISKAVEKMSSQNPAGATDLGEMFAAALSLVHDSVQPAIVYVGDGLATSGETESDALAERLRRAMGNSRARLFTIAVGAGANRSLLSRLAKVGGGKMFRIDLPEQVVQESLRFAGQLKTPTITELHINTGAGLDQLFTTHSGKLSEGEEAILLARTHHQFPDSVDVTGTLGGKPFTEKYRVKVESGAEFSYIPSLWARMYLASLMGSGLEENRGRIISLGLQYGLMTPYSSFLVLDEPQPMSGPAHLQPWRSWAKNMIRKPYRPGAKEALSIPLFGFGCSESSYEEAADAPSASPHEAAQDAVAQNAEMAKAPAPVTLGQLTGAKSEAQPPPASPSVAPRKKMATSSAMDDLLGAASGGGKGAIKSDYRGRAERAKEKMRRRIREQRDAKDESSASEGYPGTGRGGVSLDDLENDALSMQVAVTKTKPFQLAVCSDAASRPLRERRVLWQQRLGIAGDAQGKLRVFKEAGERCELMTARQRRILLDLIAATVTSAGEVQGLLQAFAEYPTAARYLRRWIRRSFLDADATMGLYVGSTINWHAVKTGLAALETKEARLKEIRKVVAKHPDGYGRQLLINILIENGMLQEAKREAEKLHRQGEASPEVLVTLCDILAATGKERPARRICSELVEFNAQNTAVRRKLGDIFLRHGWYRDAYRQYSTLTEDAPDDAVALLRLAIAAAGMGKTDEALRIARKVSTSDGELGELDPRPWAQALSVALLARMLNDAKKQNHKSMVAALERQLKRTGIFDGQKQIHLMLWEDFEFPPVARLMAGDSRVSPMNEVKAAIVGVYLFDLGESGAPNWRVTLDPAAGKGMTKRNVAVQRIQIDFDGTHFNVTMKDETFTPV